MTSSLIIACVISVTAALVAIAALIGVRRQAARNRAERERTFPAGGGVITFPQRMSDAEVTSFRARWQATYGQTGEVCDAYQLPATAADSGLCARCGMYDYKHKEATGA